MRDGFHGLGPVRSRYFLSTGTESAHGIGGRSTVAEEPRARLAGDADGLVPLQRIDVLGNHVIASNS
jgi:hypothetical protein